MHSPENARVSPSAIIVLTQCLSRVVTASGWSKHKEDCKRASASIVILKPHFGPQGAGHWILRANPHAEAAERIRRQLFPHQKPNVVPERQPDARYGDVYCYR